ncbi:uncharacterized protein LOC135367896 [Ornithodoros turicata]|uniref:uncharacterized protein LOC135367896 n=1 Tax=Ornithodoros turicata TaxID=34597 RepID=UPI0031393FB3
MDSAGSADFYVLRCIFLCLDLNDLFNVCEVNRTWQSAGVSVLREKLRYLCFCHLKSPEKCRITEGGQPRYLGEFCEDLRRFIRIARLADLKPTFGFLSYSSNPTDEKAVVRQVQRELSTSCVIVYHRSRTISLRNEMKPTEPYSVHKGITGAFLFGPLVPKTAQRSLDAVRRQQSTAPAHPAQTLPQYKAQSSFKRNRLGRLSKLFRRAVLRRQMEEPCLRNVAPGVMLFHSFRIPQEDGRCLSMAATEAFTGRTVVVSFMQLFHPRDATSVQRLLQEFRKGFGPQRLQDTFVIVFQKDLECVQELSQITGLFREVPVMSMSGEFPSETQMLQLQQSQTERRVVVITLSLSPLGFSCDADLEGILKETWRYRMDDW